MQFPALEAAPFLAWGAQVNEGLKQFTDASGSISLQAELSGTGQALTQARLTGMARKINFNGPSAAENAGGSLQWTMAKGTGETWDIQGHLRLTEGQIYVEPGVSIKELPLGFILSTPPEGLSLAMQGRLDGRGRWDIGSINFLHPGVSELAFSGVVLSGDKRTVSGTLRAKLSDLGAAYKPYLEPFLLATGYGTLETAGAMEATVRVQENRLTDLRFGFRDVYVDDLAGRFNVAGLNGGLAVNSGPEPVTTRLHWAGGGLYQLDIGKGQLVLVSQAGNLWLQKKAQLPVLDGGLAIESLRFEKVGQKDFSMRLDAQLNPVSLTDFCHAMGWPPMQGTVSGRIPGAFYQPGVLRVGGTLVMQAFDGRFVIQDLRIERLFGPVPTLDANVLVKEIDLESLTGAFSFGKIQGRLSGQVKRLRLEDWQPVYFEAAFASPEEDDKPHRISQRAVENLTSLGGGMTVSAASGILLRMFDEFSYDRLGLKCHLHEGVCDMDGVEPVDGGYYIVKRGLLPPWIDVKGFNRQVDWDVLVERLKGVTASEGPVIE